ncbi:alpha beta hydrolase fold protein [Grosmannia clavigera kw1407]|uniref:Alpha beta hydrolase fold protein n=1 Tax=Grosmannia clavigera (strain kw1407 / UAMH 11150) TaxID=655863 RepID=F0XNL2_GROCL|nr:alpha beta hydrolase fold protein [Grosmannia clavigera kw1407]EFX00097.1 alpha beta hydrolase fold protein [Grosmannia clavigera kw1407]
MAHVSLHDPNPGFGRISLLDVVKTLGALGAVSLQAIFFLLGQFFRRSRPTPRLKEFKIFLLRKMLGWLPNSILRRPTDINHILASKRYGQRVARLVEKVDRPDLSGVWLCKPGFESVDSANAPSSADVVILFAHGGGYVIGQPGLYATLLLHVAERIVAEGQTVAVFALDYSLAPESPFPSQLRQMVACWEYLVGEMGISTSKLALLGDSAGGSLCLSFLAHMASPLARVPAVSDRTHPGRGLYLMSPWVSLLSERGYAAKATTDALEIGKLRQWASMEIGGADISEVHTYLDFAGGREDLADILPSYTWVSAGGGEMFLENISRFVSVARAAGRKVDFDVKDGEAHDWQLMESVQLEKKFLAQEFGTGVMAGADGIAKAIVATGAF